jgi:N-acetylglucosaminyltransferase
MIALIREILIEVIRKGKWITPYLVTVAYFTYKWLVKVAYSRFYRPIDNGFAGPVTVVMPIYQEEAQILAKAIQGVLAQPPDLVNAVILVTDARQTELSAQLAAAYLGRDSRVRLVETKVPGKRNSLALGIRRASGQVVVSVESDVFLNQDSIRELIRPLHDPQVGGVVGQQWVYDPYAATVNLFNHWQEMNRNRYILPALSVRGQVTVLAGRCVAYRRSAVLPLLHALTHERFLGRICVSGDDGRLTSLLLQHGWKTKFQSTSIVETIGPDNWRDLFVQRLRWFRNWARRTSRAMLSDGHWVWKKPLAAWQMLYSWLDQIMMVVMIIWVVRSVRGGYWFWFGRSNRGITIRVGMLILGLTLTRALRMRRVIANEPKKTWIWLLLYPWYLLGLWVNHLVAILTMNRQGWLSRRGNGAGGFVGNRNGHL